MLSGLHASLGLPLDLQPQQADYAPAHLALARMGVAELARRPLHTLSTGQMRRVLIARALVHAPQALLLDEPGTGLDIAAQLELRQQLRQLAREGVTLVLVTHQLEEVLPEMQQVLLLRDGQLQAAGTPEQVLTSAQLSALFGIPLTVQRQQDRWNLLPR